MTLDPKEQSYEEAKSNAARGYNATKFGSKIDFKAGADWGKDWATARAKAITFAKCVRCNFILATDGTCVACQLTAERRKVAELESDSKAGWDNYRRTDAALQVERRKVEKLEENLKACESILKAAQFNWASKTTNWYLESVKYFEARDEERKALSHEGE